jgi:hypothetical protein
MKNRVKRQASQQADHLAEIDGFSSEEGSSGARVGASEASGALLGVPKRPVGCSWRPVATYRALKTGFQPAILLLLLGVRRDS